MRLSLVAIPGILFATAALAAGNIHKVNESISIAPGESQDEVSTVNGSIRIDDRAVVGRASTVNGSIKLGSGATASGLSTVNGSLQVQEEARISGDVSTVNGSVSLGKRADVAGDVSTVNGTIRLDQASIHGKLESTNGGIDVGEGSRVDGGILMHSCRRNGGSGLSGCDDYRSRHPRVVIHANATVQGVLKFEREVELYVSDKATIGRVEGATPIRFSGSEPPARR
jgi:carbonic anhydrase/acetyltransferase-like protein (isoleucine patch superfamily)